MSLAATAGGMIPLVCMSGVAVEVWGISRYSNIIIPSNPTHYLMTMGLRITWVIGVSVGSRAMSSLKWRLLQLALALLLAYPAWLLWKWVLNVP